MAENIVNYPEFYAVKHKELVRIARPVSSAPTFVPPERTEAVSQLILTGFVVRRAFPTAGWVDLCRIISGTD